MEKKNKLLLIGGSSVAFRAFFALYNQIDRFKNANVVFRGLRFNLMLSHLLSASNRPMSCRFWCRRRFFGRRCMPTTRGPCNLMSSMSSFPSFVSNWSFGNQPIWASSVWSEWYWLGTLDKMAETTSVPFDVTIVSGDKDLIHWLTIRGGLKSPKGVAGLEEFTQPISKKMGLTLWAIYQPSRPWWEINRIISQVSLRSEKRQGSNQF